MTNPMSYNRSTPSLCLEAWVCWGLRPNAFAFITMGGTEWAVILYRAEPAELLFLFARDWPGVFYILAGSRQFEIDLQMAHVIHSYMAYVACGAAKMCPPLQLRFSPTPSFCPPSEFSLALTCTPVCWDIVWSYSVCAQTVSATDVHQSQKVIEC